MVGGGAGLSPNIKPSMIVSCKLNKMNNQYSVLQSMHVYRKNYSVMKYLKNNDIKFKINDFSKFCNRLVSLTKVQKNLIVVHYLNIRTIARIWSSTARASCNRFKFATVCNHVQKQSQCNTYNGQKKTLGKERDLLECWYLDCPNDKLLSLFIYDDIVTGGLLGIRKTLLKFQQRYFRTQTFGLMCLTLPRP